MIDAPSTPADKAVTRSKLLDAAYEVLMAIDSGALKVNDPYFNVSTPKSIERLRAAIRAEELQNR